ncbi:MAG: PorV/PorQ family protein [Candidatus Eisenbacteria bacterium]
MKWTWLVCALAVIPAASQAAQEFEKVGTIGGQFLKIGVGARAQALGGAFVSVADDASAIYWNPAGVARISKSVVNINHTAWLADVNFTQAAYVFEVGFVPGKLALNARSLYMDSQPIRTVFRPEGTGQSFDAGDVAFGLTYARSFTDKFSAGVSGNYLQSTLYTYSASAFTFDFGTLYDTGYRSLRIGMAIQNIGSDMVFKDDPVKMLTVFRVRMSMNLYESDSHILLSAADFSHPPDNNERASWDSSTASRSSSTRVAGINSATTWRPTPPESASRSRPGSTPKLGSTMRTRTWAICPECTGSPPTSGSNLGPGAVLHSGRRPTRKRPLRRCGGRRRMSALLSVALAAIGIWPQFGTDPWKLVSVGSQR